VDALVRAKLGMQARLEGDIALVADLFDMMHRAPVDYTRFFRLLSAVTPNDADARAAWHDAVDDLTLSTPWLERWLARMAVEPISDADRRTAMEAVNPKFVLRNWIAQEVIEAAVHRDTAPFDAVMALLRRPFDEHPGMERYADGPPEGTVEVAVSCSS
jgi:uncharacterized protein YdiU (UPF0061 family)